MRFEQNQVLRTCFLSKLIKCCARAFWVKSRAFLDTRAGCAQPICLSRVSCTIQSDVVTLKECSSKPFRLNCPTPMWMRLDLTGLHDCIFRWPPIICTEKLLNGMKKEMKSSKLLKKWLFSSQRCRSLWGVFWIWAFDVYVAIETLDIEVFSSWYFPLLS